MPKLTVLTGPAGSGKTTYAKKLINSLDAESQPVYVNQDSQSKDGHVRIFLEALKAGKDIIVDRMGFNKEQRNRYLSLAKEKCYNTEIIVLHESYATCLDRALKRIGSHETIKDEKGARSALQTFFTKYERPQEGEADVLTFIYPEGPKIKAVISDLDGTLCNVDHRLHFVRPQKDFFIKVIGEFDPVELFDPPPVFKKNWKAFFDGIPDDTVNQWCATLLRSLGYHIEIVYCSGRSDNDRKSTVEWLKKHNLAAFNEGSWAPLYMRDRYDSREDSIIKEIILHFELKTRYDILFVIDDRPSVCRMWRRNGLTVLQCNDKEF